MMTMTRRGRQKAWDLPDEWRRQSTASAFACASVASEAEAELHRPGVDVDAGEGLLLDEPIHRTQVSEGDAEEAVIAQKEACARVDSELPVRGGDRPIELEAAHVAAAREGFGE